jgi:hypothetical protein
MRIRDFSEWWVGELLIAKGKYIQVDGPVRLWKLSNFSKPLPALARKAVGPSFVVVSTRQSTLDPHGELWWLVFFMILSVLFKKRLLCLRSVYLSDGYVEFLFFRQA